METTVNNTMVKIQTVTVGSGGATSIDFNPVPQTYTDLLVRFSGRLVSTSSFSNVYAVFNSDTGANYKMRRLYGDGASAVSDNNMSMVNALVGGINGSAETANTFSNFEFYIPNYTSSNQKSISVNSVTENNATTAYSYLVSALWTGTSAISSISLSSTSNFAQYTTATLYGITATPNTTKASGGIIYQDATYMYHVFPYSSTFTPSATLSCDVLVVAGGGGGARSPGGAGGLCYQSGRSVSAASYSVTVGAGSAGVAYPSAASNGSNSVFDTITALGGGGGVSEGNNGQSGGSGSGGAGTNSTFTGGSATQGNSGGATGYGNAGGNGTNYYNSGGGGGAGGAGGASISAPTNQGGAGGVGLSGTTIAALDVFGSVTGTGQLSGGHYYYAGGGGGYSQTAGSGGAGGLGGGGNGYGQSTAGTNATANTGGGGGGYGTPAGYNGGSGIVIVRYAK